MQPLIGQPHQSFFCKWAMTKATANGIASGWIVLMGMCIAFIIAIIQDYFYFSTAHLMAIAKNCLNALVPFHISLFSR
ncbi:uncharacterized protein BO66DRAFT_142672 [Aspergillus aculeatinus CBS 121060]|uniref:Uncharacterized protein n=1 Tax=Aspergillus aculeatinus CBS 121060 TaxID=1448322 RepID=A0ACD1HKM9_9EURO|nr:hypothetical protein BO66DRAFT_142672 [Aspergillus aculeatinus CBS 121060]RAH74115.1 hypothetical protein BO66DRAFT_142672 [Aspergillus aculeatinus CBS 121060]